MRLCASSSMSCWTGAVSPSFGRVDKTHRITLTEILRTLEPLNEGRDKRDQITYDSLWVHFPASLRPCRESGLLENPDVQGVQEGPRGITGCRTRIESLQRSGIKYEELIPGGITPQALFPTPTSIQEVISEADAPQGRILVKETLAAKPWRRLGWIVLALDITDRRPR